MVEADGCMLEHSDSANNDMLEVKEPQLISSDLGLHLFNDLLALAVNRESLLALQAEAREGIGGLKTSKPNQNQILGIIFPEVEYGSTESIVQSRQDLVKLSAKLKVQGQVQSILVKYFEGLEAEINPAILDQVALSQTKTGKPEDDDKLAKVMPAISLCELQWGKAGFPPKLHRILECVVSGKLYAAL